MSKEREALKLALEALEVANSCVDGYYIPKGKTQLPEVEEAITAIKEALAQTEQESFCYVNVNAQGDVTRTVKRKDAWCKTPLYTTPPQRTWVHATEWRGLTDEEVMNMEAFYAPSFYDFYVAIEAKLKEKNMT